MAFTKTANLKGFEGTYSVSPNAKPYTLRDNGFVDTKGGNYQYKRSLDSSAKHGLVFKVAIDKELNQLKMSTVSEKGFKSVDVTQLSDNAMLLEKIQFILDGFVDRNVLVRVTE